VIHHVSIAVSDLERSAAFYDALFAALGWRRHTDSAERVGWGISKPWFFVTNGAGSPVTAGSERVCFSASGMAAVKGAWESGVQAGGTDDGEPSQRPELGTSYYSAYLLDPDGYRLEVAVET
jgi:catechol 2,3-dioxygenase-like lactoylglutathione lyase family enzyme